MNLDFYKELYFHEWDRKERLASSTNLLVALLTVLVGSSFYLVRTYLYCVDFYTAFFIILAGSAIVCQIVAIYYVVRSLYGYWYQRLPSSQKLQNYFNELIEYHRNLGNPIERAQKDFEQYLEDRLAEATDANRERNRETGGFLHKATGTVVATLIFSGLSLVPYIWQSFSKLNEKEKIQVEETVKVNPSLKETTTMSEEEEQQQSQESQESNQQQTQPPKPQGPPNEEVRKGGDVRVKR